MNYERICYGCFRERPAPEGDCPYCGYGPHVEHPANTLPPGTILAGRYLSGKVLGVGGFGATYLAFDMKLEEKCACKEYLPSGMAVRTSDRYTLSVARSENRGIYENGMDKFLNEARILARLKDVPNIVSVRDFFQENGTAYFVMQYIEGRSLQSLLNDRGGRLSYEETERILLPVMRALSSVHAKQLLHRDISPDNIYLTKSGEPILLDFGAARSSAGDGATMSVILKHGFAPIEQYSSHGNQGAWTDVYALAATMYRCLTGQLPPNAVDRLHTDGLVPPSALGAELPAAAEGALLTALAVRPENRFVSMQAFVEALEKTQPSSMTRISAASPPPAHAAGKKLRLPLPLPAIIGIAAAAVALIIILVAVRTAGSRSGGFDSASQVETTGSSVETGPPAATPVPATPTPSPTGTTDYEIFADPEVGLTFHYLPDDAEISVPEATADEVYRAVFFSYDGVEIMAGRVGKVDASPEDFLKTLVDPSEESEGAIVGEQIREGDMGPLHYYYTILQNEDALYVYYVTEIKEEIVAVVEYLQYGEQTQEQANQLGTIASTMDLL